MKRAIIRGFWGLHQDDLDFPMEMAKYSFYDVQRHGEEYKEMSLGMDNAWERIASDRCLDFDFDYKVYLFGRRYYDALKSIGLDTKIVSGSPYVYHPQNSDWHIFDVINHAMDIDSYGEVIYLGWDWKPTRPLDMEHIWGMLNEKSSIQCCLQKFQKQVVSHRGRRREPNTYIPQAGFIYVRNKMYIDNIFSMKHQYRANQALAKVIDDVHGEWIGKDKYLDLYEPLCAEAKKQPDGFSEQKEGRVFFRHDPLRRRLFRGKPKMRDLAISGKLSGISTTHKDKHEYCVKQILDHIGGEKLTVLELGSVNQSDSYVFCDNPKIEKIYIVAHGDVNTDIEKIRHFNIPLRKALGNIEDETIDILYVNQLGDYETIKRELLMCVPKLKKNAYVCGCCFDPRTGNVFMGMSTAIKEVVGDPDKVFMDRSWISRL